MTITINRFLVVLESSGGQGLVWVVRIYKKRLLRKKLLSSDWFLDERQAREFATAVAENLKAGGTAERFAARPPGWTMPALVLFARHIISQ